MRPSVFGASLAFAAAAFAHNSFAHRDAHAHHAHLAARQSNASGSASHTGTVSASASASAPAGASASASPSASRSGTTVPTGSSTASTPSVTLGPVQPAVTAAGAIPLAQIVPASAQSVDPSGTSALPSTTAGAKPSGMPNAPDMPDISSWNSNVSKYPKADVVPPTDSPQVLQWIQQVRDSGILIPDLEPTHYSVDGNNCLDPLNVPRVKNDTYCWWTCGHCVRNTDIVECAKPKVWGSSFDDGPTPDTAKLLHYLDENKLKTTFFVVGSRVLGRPEYLQTQYQLGHQIGVHTWSHTALTSQTSEQIIAEFGWTKKIIKDAIGVTPLYLRPPFGDIDDRVRAIARAMNLVPVMWTGTGSDADYVSFDTFDWEVPGGGVSAQGSVDQFNKLLQAADAYGKGFIVLEHDLWWQEVELAVGYFLPTALARGYQVTSINQCMNQQLQDTYSETTTTKMMPAGSGIGSAITGSSTKAPANAPLGGSDGSSIDPNVRSSDATSEDINSGSVPRDFGTTALFAAVFLAGVLAVIPSL